MSTFDFSDEIDELEELILKQQENIKAKKQRKDGELPFQSTWLHVLSSSLTCLVDLKTIKAHRFYNHFNGEWTSSSSMDWEQEEILHKVGQLKKRLKTLKVRIKVY
jgi:hypothetical protein